ncbi:peptide/nickel transport system substrate-binding protein [Roseomonas rosea]|uniref:Peptide/nickel transport system substrate-binding protein n=1 Tax=Muricoccus roseus TaxID=198092 RepID=A0A1M6EQW7_9PROT|nr:ABC transporter substrate-binding protein [Roseomonas rosea]SHI87833.1 peptide/nickel transport system substrate-binding protein [Roseomonas rosea]
MPINSTRRAILQGGAGLAAALAAPGAMAQPRPGEKRVLKAVMHATLGVLDPYATTAYITRNHGYLVYDTLFALDGRSRPQPQMVGEWSVSEDRLTYEFRLRPGLKFHDDTPVTTADVIASLNRWMPRDVMGTRLRNVTERLEAVDAERFRLVLKRPYGLVLETLGKPGGPVPFILPRRIVEIPADQRITEVVGSGPFRFIAAEYRSGDRVVYERFDGYAPRSEPASGLAGGKVAKVDRIEWMEISDAQTGANALLAGEVHVMENIPPDLMGLMRRSRDVVLKARGASNSILMRFNSAQAPFNNRKVRQAVMAAVSQKDYLDAQIGDDSLAQPCASVLSCESPYAADLPVPTGNIERARQLLRESGYANEKVVILHPADLPSGSALAPVTEQLLRSIGMNVQVDSMDWNSLLARRNRNVPVEQGGWSIAWGIWTNLDLMNPIINLNLDGRGGRGYVGWAESAEMERLREAFAFETDPAKQKEIAADLQRLSNEEAFSIPLGGYKVVTGHRSGVRGVVVDQILVFWNMELA